MRVLLECLISVMTAALAPLAAGAAEPSAKPSPSHHEGYYYPKITSREVYTALTRPLAKMDRHARLLFVSSAAQQQIEGGYAPRYASFAKGDDAEELIIIGLDETSFATLYRARAVMAALSSLARLSPLLKDADLEDALTYYDLIHLLGFKTITISDGRNFTHRVTLRD
jgi:hypothetical protein